MPIPVKDNSQGCFLVLCVFTIFEREFSTQNQSIGTLISQNSCYHIPSCKEADIPSSRSSINETREAAQKDELKVKIFIKPVKKYDAETVKNIRLSLHMTQAVFAGMLGGSQKTVEVWEAGRNIPMGPASRVQNLLAEDSTVAERFVLRDVVKA